MSTEVAPEPTRAGPPAPPEPRRAADRRRFLAVGLGVFFSGAVLLGMEIAASRVLAPYFGNSLYVWGALIGVVLAGLAVGYWIGGALADRLPDAPLLLGVMGLGAALVLAIPLVDEPVLEAIVRWDPGPRLNPLLTAVILFGPASVVLASVSPIAVRLVARSVASVGRTAGRLFSVSTVGSIVGTFAAAFFLLPELGTSELLALSAAVLFGAAALVAGVERLPAVALAGAGACAAAVVASISLAPESGERLEGVAARNWSPVYRLRGEDAVGRPDYGAEGFDVVFQRDTQYHRLAVVDDTESRFLRFDSSFQSGMWLDRPFATRFSYTDYFDLALAYNRGARRILMIGLGGGSTPKQLWQDFPGLELQAVEIDPVVVDVAHRYFELPRDERIRVAVEDGRRFLARTDEQWDAILIDAYYSDSIPFHLATREFVELARSRLAPGGVIVSNVIGALTGENSRLLRSFVRTYSTAFPTVLVHPVWEGGRNPADVNNLMLVATESAAPAEGLLVERWREIREQAPGAPDLAAAIRDRWDEPIRVADVPTLTDEYAPLDALLLVD